MEVIYYDFHKYFLIQLLVMIKHIILVFIIFVLSWIPAQSQRLFEGHVFSNSGAAMEGVEVITGKAGKIQVFTDKGGNFSFNQEEEIIKVKLLIRIVGCSAIDTMVYHYTAEQLGYNRWSGGSSDDSIFISKLHICEY